jgi:hypothetical protein
VERFNCRVLIAASKCFFWVFLLDTLHIDLPRQAAQLSRPVISGLMDEFGRAGNRL